MARNTTSLRATKKQKTRELIIETASRMFLEQGFENTTVDQIAAAAEVSQRTFFRYFPSKQAVVFADHQRRLDGFHDILDRYPERAAPLTVARQALLELAREYQNDHLTLLREWQIVRTSPQLIARDVELDFEFELAISEMIKMRLPPHSTSEMRSRILAGALFGAVRATMDQWYTGGCEGDLVKLNGQAFDILEAGIL